MRKKNRHHPKILDLELMTVLDEAMFCLPSGGGESLVVVWLSFGCHCVRSNIFGNVEKGRRIWEDVRQSGEL